MVPRCPFKGLCLFTDDVLAQLSDNFAWRQANGMVSDAVVFVNPEGEALTRAQLEREYRQFGSCYRFFESVDEAMSWSRHNLKHGCCLSSFRQDKH